MHSNTVYKVGFGLESHPCVLLLSIDYHSGLACAVNQVRITVEEGPYCVSSVSANALGSCVESCLETSLFISSDMKGVSRPKHRL